VSVGWGVTAQISATAYACWDGQRAFEPPATSSSDCWENQAFVTVAAGQCGPSTVAGPDGSLVFTWRGTVAPALLPFLHRSLTVQVIIDRNGRAEVIG